MTVADHPTPTPGQTHEGGQHFTFEDVDWEFYTQIGQRLADRRVFTTYYKGRLEIVTVSYLHDRVVALLSQLVWILAEESGAPLIPSGMTTLKRKDLEAGIEPDSSFYTAHGSAVREKTEIDLSVDPPPDLAIEVQITRRLGARQTIYRDIGVPEVWQFGNGVLAVLCRRGGEYERVDRSPTFPQLSPREISSFIAAGLRQDGVEWAKSVRRRVREVIDGGPAKT
jgi:Uma2 family endonuclease